MILAELLTEILNRRLDRRRFGFPEIERFTKDHRWGYQEKFNGERRIICKEGNSIRVFNRKGEIGKSLPYNLVRLLLSHPLPQFVIDTEVVQNKTIHILDGLVLGDEQLVHDSYEYREARCHAEFDNFHASIRVVKTVRDEKGKRELLKHLWETNCEGVVIRRMDAIYKQERAGQHFKFKFWKELDAVVIGPSPEGKDSVRIGVYDERGRLHEICGVSLIGKVRVAPGDVLVIKYLYATADLNIVQPTILKKRTDKSPRECTVTQLELNKNFMR